MEEFLGALGAQRIEWAAGELDLVRGTVVYDETDPEERQDFCWRVAEATAPSEEALALASLIRAQDLLSIDKLIVGPEELRQRYCGFTGNICSVQRFGQILEELESIEVPMVDGGVESDAYFIHQ